MRKYLLCVFLLVVVAASTEASPHPTVERSLCFFHDLCTARHRSVSAFCRLMGQWNGLDGSRMETVCGDYSEDDEDEEEDEEDEEEDEEDEEE